MFTITITITDVYFVLYERWTVFLVSANWTIHFNTRVSHSF